MTTRDGGFLIALIVTMPIIVAVLTMMLLVKNPEPFWVGVGMGIITFGLMGTALSLFLFLRSGDA